MKIGKSESQECACQFESSTSFILLNEKTFPIFHEPFRNPSRHLDRSKAPRICVYTKPEQRRRKFIDFSSSYLNIFLSRITYDLLDGIRRDYNNKAISSNWRRWWMCLSVQLESTLHTISFFSFLSACVFGALKRARNAFKLWSCIERNHFENNNKSTLNYRWLQRFIDFLLSEIKCDLKSLLVAVFFSPFISLLEPFMKTLLRMDTKRLFWWDGRVRKRGEIN